MKSKSLLLLLPFFLFSCSSPSYELQLQVATPAGAPAVAFYRNLTDEAHLEVNADPSNVVAYLSENSSKDVVICPTNAGMAAITKKKAPFKIAATVTFGNFYLAGTGNDDNGILNDDDYVVVFQKGNVPDKIFSYVYDGMKNVHYVDSAAEAAQVLISGKDLKNNNESADYVFIAEPALTNALSKNQNASEYANIQEAFEVKSNGMSLTQASIFVSNSAEKSKVDALLSSLESDIASFVANPDVIDNHLGGADANMIQSKLSSPLAALKTLTKKGNRLGLGYKKAKDNKKAIETFCGLFGITEINEEAYYQ